MEHKQAKPKILASATTLPKYTRTTEEILPYVRQWISGQPERFQKKVLKIFQYARVDRRYGIMDIDQIFAPKGFEERNDYYIEQVIEISEDVLKKALAKAELNPEDIDFIITVSCTGFMIPSLDAYLINRLRMRPDIVRLPVTEMGCAAGVSATIYAQNLLMANPGKKAAIIAVESPLSTVQLDDFSMTNMVCAAIFGDGAACTIMGYDDEKVGPVILNSEMYHFYDEIHMMGYKVRDTGFQMVLDQTVPEKIQTHFPKILDEYLAKNGVSIKDIEHFIFHPGGKKIVQTVEELLEPYGKNIDVTKEVLRQNGNMSSATVLYVLEQILEQETAAGAHGMMLSFGPGFSAQRVLLQWQ